jgi:hypothetical protein
MNNMDNYKKYLKYKNKYINLKKLFGGAFNTIINLVAIPMNKHIQLVGEYDQNAVVYKNNLLQKNETINLKNINDYSENMYQQAKDNNEFNEIDFVELYDTIGLLFNSTIGINELWNGLANKVKLNIAIFNGDISAIKYLSGIKKLRDEHYIKGVNILYGCMTDTKAKELNTPENNACGKYFIGFKGYVHAYGNSIYVCGDCRLEIKIHEFISEYKKYTDEYPDEYPINRIIKIFFSKFKHCEKEGCRNCDVINLNKIEEKLSQLKKKIDLCAQFTGKKDHYFNSEFHNNCKILKCTPDLEFENYIRSTVRRDHPFVFQQILDENYKKWFTIKRYEYRNVIYMNYVYFLISYCIDNDSPKCKMILTQLLEELGFSKNQYKKNITKSIRWKQ